jgi:hypothetical protein
MFGRMVDQLKKGELPSSEQLSSLVKVALIKKQGVLQQPPACWSNDPKINPDATQLLWAAALLGNEEEIQAAAGIMMSEMMARPGSTGPDKDLTAVTKKLEAILVLAPSREFELLLKEKVDQVLRLVTQPDNSC